MSFNKTSRVILFLILLVSVLGSAYGLQVESEAVDRSIKAGETAEYILTITNDGDSFEKFYFDTKDFRWSILSSPRPNFYSGFELGPGQSTKFVVELTPNGDLFYGIYGVLVEFWTDTTRFDPITLTVEIESPYGSALEYAPVVVIDASINKDDRIDPRATSTLVIDLDNRNPLNISELDVIVESPFVNEKFTTSLKPLDKRRIEFNFKVDPLETPRVENLVLTLKYKNKTLSGTPKSIPVQIISYSEILREVSEESDIFNSKVQKKIIFENSGNIDNTDVLKIKTNYLSRIFTHAQPAPKYVWEDKVQYARWDIELAPNKTAEINIEVNYRPVFYAIVLIVASVILYFLMRSPVVVKKSAAGINMYEGGVSEMKVLIHIRNRTQNSYNTFNVTEYIPKFANFIKSEALGSIVPNKVLRHEKRGTLLKWNFEAIEPFEERIIIFKVKLNLTVLGRFSLPATTVKFKDDATGSYTVKSNKLRITNAGTDENIN